jgi:hypothetical protein
MGPEFRVYAVLPTPGPGADSAEKAFAQQTRGLLAKAEGQGVRTVELDALDTARKEVIELLL